jgi:hypothetical protein
LTRTVREWMDALVRKATVALDRIILRNGKELSSSRRYRHHLRTLLGKQ